MRPTVYSLRSFNVRLLALKLLMVPKTDEVKGRESRK